MAVVLLCVAGLFSGLLLSLLFAPVYLEADTSVPLFRFRWMPFGEGTLFFNGQWQLRYRILFFGKTLNLEEGKTATPRRAPAKRAVPEPSKRKETQITPRRMLRFAGRLLGSFRVHTLVWALDTGNFVWNAQLYPFTALPAVKGHFFINFHGQNYLYCNISNRLWHIAVAWFRTFIFHSP